MNTTDPLIAKALKFATEKHAGQTRKYTGEPYIVHPIGVAEEVARHTQRAQVIAAALLHDTIEDCGVTREEIVLEFGHEVGLYVHELTDYPSPEPRRVRKAASVERLYKAAPESQLIKACDLLCNTDSIVQHDPNFARVYLPEKRAVLDVLTSVPIPLLEKVYTQLELAERQLQVVDLDKDRKYEPK